MQAILPSEMDRQVQTLHLNDEEHELEMPRNQEV